MPGSLSLPASRPMPVLRGALILRDSDGSNGAGNDPGDIGPEPVRAGLFGAGPLVTAGPVNNGVNVIVAVLMGRFTTTHGYGRHSWLTGLFSYHLNTRRGGCHRGSKAGYRLGLGNGMSGHMVDSASNATSSSSATASRWRSEVRSAFLFPLAIVLGPHPSHSLSL